MPDLLRRFLSLPVIARLPVRVRGGVAKGARWTFFPWTAYWRGTHEPAAQACILALRSDWTGAHVWDLGSHYGLFAVGLGLRAGPTGSVAAFEPNPLSHARLALHVRRNRLAHVKTFPCAVSDQAGNQRFFLYEGLESTSSHLAYENETWDESIPSMHVPAVRLDDLVASGEINPPDFIKVDVEGHGHKALAGAAATLARCRPVLLIGFHTEAEISGVLAVLTPLRYRITPVNTVSPAVPAPDHDYLFEPLP
jgi:FkbM family methyltransferase